MPFLYLTLLVVCLDQIAKLIVEVKMVPLQSVPLLKDWLAITYVTNYGAAFGIMQSQTLLLIAISLGVIFLIWFNRRQLAQYPTVLQLGLALALGGAGGNLIDRVRLGYVVDFFDFHVWPVFNIADMAIVAGVGLIILGMLWKDLILKHNQRQRINGTSDSTVSGDDKQ